MTASHVSNSSDFRKSMLHTTSDLFFYGGESKPLSACVTKSEWYIYAIPYFLPLVWKIMQILQSKMMLQKFCKAIKTNRLPPEKFAFLLKHLKNWNRCDLLTKYFKRDAKKVFYLFERYLWKEGLGISQR